MQRVNGKRNRRRGGFTLLEVLLVIAIIALLAAAVVPQFMKIGDQAKIDNTKNAVSAGGGLGTSLKLYRQTMGAYPEELKELYTKPDDEDKAKKWAGPYIEDSNTLKDSWEQEFIYKAPGEVNTEGYDLSSKGPDGNEGTDDDITNWKKE